MKEHTFAIRIDDDTFEQAQDRLQEMGLTVEDAVTTLLESIAKEGKLPFAMPQDNEEEKKSERKEEILIDLYGETPTADAEDDPGFFESDEMNPFVK